MANMRIAYMMLYSRRQGRLTGACITDAPRPLPQIIPSSFGLLPRPRQAPPRSTELPRRDLGVVSLGLSTRANLRERPRGGGGVAIPVLPGTGRLLLDALHLSDLERDYLMSKNTEKKRGMKGPMCACQGGSIRKLTGSQQFMGEA